MTAAIAILGAGPSGLMLGRLLELANIPFVIFERDGSESTADNTYSGTLDIRADSGQVALQEAGLLDQFKSTARYDATVKIADAKGKVYIYLEEEENGPEKPEIDRTELRALLLGSIPPHRIRWGCHVQSVQRNDNDLMSVHLAGDRIESGFRLVVGADGAWSKARSLITTARPGYSGFYMLRTAVRPEHPLYSTAVSLAGRGLYLAMGGERQLVVVRLGDGSYQIGVGMRLSENWVSENASIVQDPTAIRHHLLHGDLTNWSQVHADLIQCGDGDTRVWPLYTMPSDSLSWQTAAGVALVGDAAHVTMPFVGEGVNCALFDSLQLARQIIKHGVDNLRQAVSDYEALMLPRGADLIQRNIESGKLLFAPDAPRGWLKTYAGMDVD